MTADGPANANPLEGMPSPPRRTRSLRPLVVVVALAAIAGFGIGEKVIDERREAIVDAAQHRAQVVSESRAELVANWMPRWQEAARPWRINPRLRLFAEQMSAAAGRTADGGELLSYFQAAMDDYFRRRPEVASAYLLDGDGNAFLATSGAVPLGDDQRQRSRDAFAQGKAGLSALKAGADGLVFDVCMPLFPVQARTDQEARRSVAVLLLAVRADRALAEALANGRTLEADEHMALVQGQGPDSEAVFFGDKTLSAVAPGGLPADGTFARIASRDGDSYRLAQPIEGTPWRMLYIHDAKGLDREILDVRVVTDLLAFAFVISIALAAALLLRRQSLQASRQLAEQYHDFARRLDVQHRLLRSINDAIVEGIVVVDPHRRVLYANTAFAALIGRPGQSCIGAAVDSLLPPGLATRLERWDAEVLEAGAPSNAIVVDHEGEAPRWLAISKAPFLDGADPTPGVVTVWRDVTQAQTERERQRRMMRTTIRVLSSSVSAVDPYLAGHAGRLADVAEGIAGLCGCSNDEIATLRIAAALSQVGKLYLPHDLIRSEERLSPEQRRQIEQHIDLALKAIKDIVFDLPVPGTLAQMHERLDGSGYPRHLRGDEMTLLGRILGVADVFAARTEPRSNRGAAKPADVIAILRAHPEKYDATVVDALERHTAHQDGGAAAAPS